MKKPTKKCCGDKTMKMAKGGKVKKGACRGAGSATKGKKFSESC